MCPQKLFNRVKNKSNQQIHFHLVKFVRSLEIFGFVFLSLVFSVQFDLVHNAVLTMSNISFTLFNKTTGYIFIALTINSIVRFTSLLGIYAKKVQMLCFGQTD